MMWYSGNEHAIMTLLINKLSQQVLEKKGKESENET